MILSGKIDSRVMGFLDDSSFFIYNIATGEANGVFQLNGNYFSVEWLKDTYRVIMVDIDSKEMDVYVNGERVDASCEKGVIDLDANGRRWEGGVRDGKPFEYGVIYDEEGRKEYEGIMMDGMKSCYGTEYYSDIDVVQYKGCYYNNNRFGKGTLYDRCGAVEYDGLWKSNKPCSSSFGGKMIDSYMESVKTPRHSFSESESFILHSFIHSLKQIVIRSSSFGKVRVFELNGLSKLESVAVAERSFSYSKIYGDIEDNERNDGVCRIVNCPKLKSIQIGKQSFSDYHSLELSNLPSLQSINADENCFRWILSFSLTGLID